MRAVEVVLVIFGVGTVLGGGLLGWWKSSQTKQVQIQVKNTDEEFSLVDEFPKPGATAREKGEFMDKVRRLSEPTQLVEISGCQPEPVGARVKLGKEMFLVNRDEQDHEISFSEELTLTVEAGQALKIKADFGNPGSAYGYACDSERAVGIILLD